MFKANNALPVCPMCQIQLTIHDNRSMKILTGKWLMMTAILLLVTSLILFGEPSRQMLTYGYITEDSDVHMKLTAWLFSLGVVSLIIGVIKNKN